MHDGPAGELRDALVRRLVEAGAITTPAVEAAMRRVPRHRLLEEVWLPASDAPPDRPDLQRHVLDSSWTDRDLLASVYEDIAIPTRMQDGLATSSTSQPALVAHMLELLDLGPGLRVLEIGAGTGYNAALLSELVGDQALVHALDIDPSVVEQTRRLLGAAGYGGIDVVLADGVLGHPDAGPYDRIVAAVGCGDVSPHWLDQLAPDGWMLIPLEHGGVHPLTRLVAEPAGGATGRAVGCSGFMRMQGVMAPHTVDRGLGSPDRQTRGPLSGALRDLDASHPRWPGWDFHYYVALTDRRAVSMLTLADARGAVRVDLQARELVTTGESDHLAARLVDHAGAWARLGRPAAGDWKSELVPIGSPASDGEGRWTIDRVYFRQLVTLGDDGRT